MDVTKILRWLIFEVEMGLHFTLFDCYLLYTIFVQERLSVGFFIDSVSNRHFSSLTFFVDQTYR